MKNTWKPWWRFWTW